MRVASRLAEPSRQSSVPKISVSNMTRGSAVWKASVSFVSDLNRLRKRAEVPVVVVGGTLNSLGVIRSLSRARVPVYLVETTRRCAAGWSRHCHFVHTPSLEGCGLIDTLVDLGSQMACRPVLITTSDQSVEWISSRREQLEPLFRFRLPSAQMVRTLSDKILFHGFAEREGLPVPRAVALAGPSDLGRMRHLVPPLVLKPADKKLVIDGVVERAVQARTVAEAQTFALRMLARASRVIVQEWVDGPDSDIFFTLFSCDRDGNVVGLFSGRKLVCTPPAIGNTAVCVAASEVLDELATMTLEFIARARYRGLGSLEFKRERTTGKLLIIEPTVGRTDWQEEIATLCGVNIPLLTYWAELERSVQCPDMPVPRFAWRSSRRHSPPPGALPRGTRVVDGYFRWSDPLPGFYFYGYERGVLRLWGRLRPAVQSMTLYKQGV